MSAISSRALKLAILEAARATPPVAPRCPHTVECGGCTIQERPYAAQVAAKQMALRALWADDLPAALHDTLHVVPSPDPFGYRTRMDYVASKDRFGLRKRGKFSHIVDLAECHLIPPWVFAIARAVYDQARALGLPDYNLVTHEGFLRYIVVRRSPQNTLLLCAVTSSDAHGAAMAALAAHALAFDAVVGFHWLLNDANTDIAWGAPLQHWGAATLPMQTGARTLHIAPNTFFQNNVHLLLPLLDAVLHAVLGSQADKGVGRQADQKPPYGLVSPSPRLPVSPSRVTLADLYGGVGTIALHMAAHVERVVCVEEVAASVALAKHNIAANGVANVSAVASDVAAFLRGHWQGTFDVMVADPPRTGLGAEVCSELLRLRPRRLVYVSCNPMTLRADVQMLAPAYTITALRGYDMFPHTPHMEALAVLDLRGDEAMRR